MSDFVVIGGGIIGVATARHLALAGAKVTLFEARSLAAMASGWTLGGVRQSGRDPAELPLARAAVEIWQTLHEDLGADIEYRQRGNLRLARTEAEADIIRALVAQQAASGLPITYLAGNAAVRAVAGDLARCSRRLVLSDRRSCQPDQVCPGVRGRRPPGRRYDPRRHQGRPHHHDRRQDRRCCDARWRRRRRRLGRGSGNAYT